MQKARIQADVIIFNAALSACEKDAQWQRALSLFDGIQKIRIQPDVITFSVTISACEKGKQWPRALRLFDGMQKAWIMAGSNVGWTKGPPEIGLVPWPG